MRAVCFEERYECVSGRTSYHESRQGITRDATFDRLK